MPWAQPKDVSIKIQNMDTLFRYVHSMDTFTKEYSCIHQIRKQAVSQLQWPNFVKTHRDYVKIIPQFKIGEYIRAEYAKQIPKYRVDFLMTFSKGGKEQALILEYDGVEYHTKNPDIVTKHNFSQEYLDYDISRQIELESYGYRFLRLNKFNLRPEQDGETKMDVLDRYLRNAFDADE